MLDRLFGRSDFSRHFRLKTHGSVTHLEVEGTDLRHPEQAMDLGEDLRRLLEEEHPRAILVDLGRVHYLCSTAFAVLLDFSNKAKAAGVPLKLCSLDPSVQIGANIIGLNRVIEIYDDAQTALESF
jgi:anti-anti-sigma factor